MTYTTSKLISILDTAIQRSIEIQCACSPLRLPGEDHADWETIFKFNAKNSQTALESYWQLREQIHAYQLEHQVSGLVSNECTYQGKTIEAFCVHDQLVAIPNDKQVLIEQTPQLIGWWGEVTQGMELWYSPTCDNKDDYCVNYEEILQLAPLAEWASVSIYNGLTIEINLRLCWGDDADSPESKLFFAMAIPSTAENLEQCLNV